MNAERGLPVRVMLVDDHPVVRKGLRYFFSRQPGIEIVAEAATVAETILLAVKHLPDVILMDVRLPDGSGIEACRAIRSEHPEIQVVMLTSYGDDEALLSSIMAGAAGYLLKEVQESALVDAVRIVSAGGSLLDPHLARQLIERIRSSAGQFGDPLLAQLTRQERRVLIEVAAGLSNKEIGVKLHLGEKTVRNYVSTILSKLQVSSRTQAATMATRHHLTE